MWRKMEKCGEGEMELREGGGDRNRTQGHGVGERRACQKESMRSWRNLREKSGTQIGGSRSKRGEVGRKKKKIVWTCMRIRRKEKGLKRWKGLRYRQRLWGKRVGEGNDDRNEERSKQINKLSWKEQNHHETLMTSIEWVGVTYSEWESKYIDRQNGHTKLLRVGDVNFSTEFTEVNKVLSIFNYNNNNNTIIIMMINIISTALIGLWFSPFSIVFFVCSSVLFVFVYSFGCSPCST